MLDTQLMWLIARVVSLLVAVLAGASLFNEPDLAKTRTDYPFLILVSGLFFLVGYLSKSSKSKNKSERHSYFSWKNSFFSNLVSRLDFMGWFFFTLGLSYLVSHFFIKPLSFGFGLLPIVIGCGLLGGTRVGQRRKAISESGKPD